MSEPARSRRSSVLHTWGPALVGAIVGAAIGAVPGTIALLNQPPDTQLTVVPLRAFSELRERTPRYREVRAEARAVNDGQHAVEVDEAWCSFGHGTREQPGAGAQMYAAGELRADGGRVRERSMTIARGQGLRLACDIPESEISGMFEDPTWTSILVAIDVTTTDGKMWVWRGRMDVIRESDDGSTWVTPPPRREDAPARGTRGRPG